MFKDASIFYLIFVGRGNVLMLGIPTRNTWKGKFKVMELRCFTLYKEFIALQKEVKVINYLQEAEKKYMTLLFLWILVWLSWMILSRMHRSGVRLLMILLRIKLVKWRSIRKIFFRRPRLMQRPWNLSNMRWPNWTMWYVIPFSGLCRLCSGFVRGCGTEERAMLWCHNFGLDIGPVSGFFLDNSRRWSRFLDSRNFNLTFIFPCSILFPGMLTRFFPGCTNIW